MLNIFSLICICFNSAIYLSNFFLYKIAQSLCLFESNRRCYASNPCTLFSISLCLASCCKFLMRSLILF